MERTLLHMVFELSKIVSIFEKGFYYHINYVT
jgi:hypothetical protein